MPIFVNGKPLAVRADATVAAVVSADDPGLAEALRDGRAYVTDGVGRPIEPGTVVFPGAIFRVVRSARGSRAE
ncbi:MAG: hypothetical protein HYW06_14585 [Gemmatimonadetes bacterium]|nr:hypothetical protein [Gemmatimonadota bacterium]MBI2538157.1 hypothetical protein [Gemmatimonadota bacterium]